MIHVGNATWSNSDLLLPLFNRIPKIHETTPRTPTPSVSNAIAEGPSNESAVVHSSSPCQSNGLCRQGPTTMAGVATAGAFFVVACAGVSIWACARRAKALKKWDNLAVMSEIVKMRRKFSYRQLSIATLGLDQSRIIGHCAFRTVYKGIIPETRAMVAIKRCI